MSSVEKKQKGLTRRHFVKGAAAGAVGGLVVGAAGTALSAPKAQPKPWLPAKWDQETDVIVAGSGPTGLPAAIAAVDKGAVVIVVEQGKAVGGCGVIAGGILNIGGGTRVQKLNGISDSPDLLFARLTNYKDPYFKRNDPALTRAFCDANPGTVDWLEQRGVRFMDTLSPSGGRDALHREVYHYIFWDKEAIGSRSMKNVSGAGLIKPLEAYARSKGVKILLEHKLTGIIREGGTTGRVLGAEIKTPAGKLYVKAKKGVILGTGSWRGNRSLRKLFDGRLSEDLGAAGEPFVNSDGSGIVAALAVGAVLQSDRTMDRGLFRAKFGTKHYNFPLNSPYGAPGLTIAGPLRADVIFVNKSGRRYVNEQDVFSLDGYSFFDASFAQEGHVLWAVFDDAAARRNKWDVKPPATEEGSAFSAPTLPELAALIKLPAQAFSETVAKYNGYVEAGKDTDFDRPKSLLGAKIETPPFHAVWISLFLNATCGGIAVNAKSQVLDIYGKVIPGLYAGGEAAGGLDFHGMLRGIILGRFAGENAAAYA